jgi:hypothetical protein
MRAIAMVGADGMRTFAGVFGFVVVLGFAGCSGGTIDDQPTETDGPSETDSDSDSDEETDEQVETPECSTYCSDMASTCPTELYSEEQCLAVCEEHPNVTPFEAGDLGDPSGNTLGCRMNYLELAKSATGAEKDEFCAQAHLSGGDVCGSYCEVYCDYAVPTCSSNNSNFTDADVFADEADCLAQCSPLSQTVSPGTGQSDQQFGYGDTKQCRLHHLQAALIEPGSADLHCGHASPSPSSLCLDDTKPNTINYCVFATEFCPDLLPAGADLNDCKALVQPHVGPSYLEAGFQSFSDTDIATVGCLNYWIMQAPLDSTACAKADWDPANWESNGGAGVCGK